MRDGPLGEVSDDSHIKAQPNRCALLSTDYSESAALRSPWRMKTPQIAQTGNQNRPARSLLTVLEVAAETGVSRRFIEMEIARGRLIAVRLSARVVRIRRSDFESYLAAGATSAA